MRIFAISDIHIDYPENNAWLDRISLVDFQNDILILAGDVSEDESLLASCFRRLKRRFANVFFVPGNHDIWVKSAEKINSLQKFERVLNLAEDSGVMTQSASISDINFVPIFSWYDYSFGFPSEFINTAWMDFRRCKWPDDMDKADKVHAYFMSLNHSFPRQAGQRVITFSHFMPRIDLMPSYIPKSRREIYPVLGSDTIDVHLRKLNSDVHIYGHSHINRSVVLDGVHYINNAFAYPNEERIARKCLLEVTSEVGW